MPVKCQTLISLIEEFAPKNLAEDWDNIGLQIGDPAAEVSKVMLTLDVNLDVALEAAEAGVDLIISHHPIIFKPMKNIRYDLPKGKLVGTLIQKGINVYAAHTNLDSAPEGVNAVLGTTLGLKDLQVLAPSSEEKLCKLVVFVPVGYEDAVLEAMSKAGAGCIGKYSECSFQIPGTGTFRPLPGAEPFTGEVGKLERTSEIRLETILPQKYLSRVIKAMEKAHPYEEVAYDLLPLLNKGPVHGLGRVGKLAEPMTLKNFAARVKTALGLETLRIGGDQDKIIKKVALCGGSGASLASKAAFAGADVLLTGDIKYHEGQDLLAGGMTFIDAGHYATEQVIVPVLKEFLTGKIQENKYGIEVIMSNVNTNPFRDI